jgi:DNA-binding transcriptional MerR regulator
MQNQPPTEKVVAMRKQGLTDNQIIQSLQQDGFSSQDVLNALEMADHNPPQHGSHVPIPPPINPMQNTPPPMFQPKPMQPQPNQVPLLKDEDMEELIEAIIDEKWAVIEKDIDRLLDWKGSVDEKMALLEHQVKDLKKNFDELHQAIIGKVGEYDKNILEVGSQLKAMEQVFSKVLPTFTDNVAELSRITDKIKRN